MKRSLLSIIISGLLAVAMHGQKAYDAYIFLAEECPISIYMLSDIKKLENQFGDQVQFHLVFPMAKSNEASARSFCKEHELKNFETIIDGQQKWASKLKAKVTPEIVVVQRENRQVEYRGQINDAFFAPGRKKHSPPRRTAHLALKKITAGESVPQPWEKAIGCFITFHN